MLRSRFEGKKVLIILTLVALMGKIISASVLDIIAITTMQFVAGFYASSAPTIFYTLGKNNIDLTPRLDENLYESSPISIVFISLILSVSQLYRIYYHTWDATPNTDILSHFVPYNSVWWNDISITSTPASGDYVCPILSYLRYGKVIQGHGMRHGMVALSHKMVTCTFPIHLILSKINLYNY